MRDNDLMSWYTVYNAKTDEIVACGTADMIVRQMGELIHWLHYHLKGSNPPPALYHLEMLLQSLEYLRGGRHYLYNSIYEITRLEAYP